MAKQQRLSRKEVLSQPDPSEVFALRVSVAVDWVKEHHRYILYGVLGVIVIAILIVAWTRWQGHRRDQAAIMLHQALKLIDENPETNQIADPDQAIDKLQSITKQYGRTPAGARAFWHLGHLYFERGEMAEALKAYQVARRRLPNRQPLSSTLAILNMGYAQESTDACGEAITSYESVQQSPIRWLHGEAYLGIGRCHEKVGATDKAIEVYDRALADVNVTGTAQQTISERLARLQPDEPAVPDESPGKVEMKESPEAAGSDATETQTESEKAPAPAETTASQTRESPETSQPSAAETETKSSEDTSAAPTLETSPAAPSSEDKPSEPTEDAKTQ